MNGANVLDAPPRAGCSRDTPACEFWTWGIDAVRPDCCTEHLRELTMFTHELLARHGIAHWIDYGTLLGAVRNGEFIPWDEDVDFGVLERDRERILALEGEVSAAGFVVSTVDPSAIHIQFSQTNELRVDLITWSLDEGRLHSSMDAMYDWPGAGDRSFPTRFIEQLEPVSLYGRELPAPSPVHEFLAEHRYGRDYMTPARNSRSPWLYPELTPEEVTPTVTRLLADLANRDRRLAELNSRSRLSRFRAWEAWRNAGRPLGPRARHLEAAGDGIPPEERSDKVEQLVYAIASFDYAIEELEHPRPSHAARRMLRRAAGGADLVAARATGRPRRVFGRC